jgi:hypothetical protein
MATYTIVSFYFAMGIAVIGSLIVLAIPAKRRIVFDALRHPLGGSEEDSSSEVVGELIVESDWPSASMAASHAPRRESAHTAPHV